MKKIKKSILCVAALMAVTAAVYAEKFTIAVISDTQNYCDYRYQRDSNPPYAFDHGDIFKRQMKYIANNSIKNGGDIAFAIHVGDIVQNGAKYESEWKIADDAMSILDNTVPYLVVPGNHDYDNPKDYSVAGLNSYVKYFGPKSKHFAGKKWYGGADETGTNSYAKFKADGKEFMVLGLQTEPSHEDLVWAQKILDKNKNIPVILDIHEYLGARYDSACPGTPVYLDDKLRADNPGSAQDVWDNLVSKNDQIFLIVCGHDFRWRDNEQHHEEGEMVRTDKNNNGYPVYQLLSDYQGRKEIDKYLGLNAHGNGDGWMRLMEFDLKNNQINIKTYSTELNCYETDLNSQFTIKLDFDWDKRFGK